MYNLQQELLREFADTGRVVYGYHLLLQQSDGSFLVTTVGDTDAPYRTRSLQDAMEQLLLAIMAEDD